MFTVQTIGRDPFYHEEVAIAVDTVSRLNANYRNNSNAVLLTFETNNVRYWLDGTIPTPNSGHISYAGAFGIVYLESPKAIRELRMIAIGGAATAMVTYFR